MSLTDDPAFCAEVEGLLCLSDLSEPTQQPVCSADDPCLHFFPGMGFRPAAWTVERDQYGDHALLIVWGDEAYLAKYDMPFDAMAFLPSKIALPLPVAPSSGLLAVPGGSPAGPGYGGFPNFPGFFFGSGSGGGSGGNGSGGNGLGGGGSGGPPVPQTEGPFSPHIPGVIIPGGAITPPGGDLPPLAPVPVSGSGLFLIVALAALMVQLARGRVPGQTA